MAATAALEVIRQPGRARALLAPTRRELLRRAGEPTSAAELARELGMPRQRINYHLRELEREGLLELVEERRKGNCVERLVRATARSFVISPEALGELGETPAEGQDRLSAGYLMSAAARTIRDVASLQAKARGEKKRLATFTLDSRVRFATARDRAAFADELAGAVASLIAKYHDDRAAGGRAFRVMAALHPTAESPTPKAGVRERGEDHD